MHSATSVATRDGTPRAGHYERRLQTKAGEVRLKVPKLRAQTSHVHMTTARRAESRIIASILEFL